jgi:hypothetical protein
MGDILVMMIQELHGYAMGFNYNGNSSAELLRKRRFCQKIRRAETVDDYFATWILTGCKR